MCAIKISTFHLNNAKLQVYDVRNTQYTEREQISYGSSLEQGSSIKGEMKSCWFIRRNGAVHVRYSLKHFTGHSRSSWYAVNLNDGARWPCLSVSQPAAGCKTMLSTPSCVRCAGENRNTVRSWTRFAVTRDNNITVLYVNLTSSIEVPWLE